MELDFELADWKTTYSEDLPEYADYWIGRQGLRDLGNSAIMHQETETVSSHVEQIAEQFGKRTPIPTEHKTRELVLRQHPTADSQFDPESND